MKALQNQRSRLQRKVHHLEKLSESLSNRRIVLFLVSGGWTLVVGLASLHPLLYAPAAAGALYFLGLVWIQDKVRTALVLFQKRLEVASRASAGAALDWAGLPALPPLPKMDLPRYFSDLDLTSGNALLRLVNHTSSTAGFRKLIEAFCSHGVGADEIRRRRLLTEELVKIRLLRRRFLVVDALWSGLIESDRVLELLQTPLHTARAWAYFYAIFLTQAMSIALFAAFSAWGGKPFFLLGGILLMVLYRFAGSEIRLLSSYGYGMSLSVSLGKLSALALVIQRMGKCRSVHLRRLLAPFLEKRSPRLILSKASTVVGLLGVKQNYILHLALNMAVPWDYFWTLRLEKIRVEVKEHLPVWLETLAQLEVGISLAEFEANHPEFCVPQIVERAPYYFRAEDLAHPLISPGTRVGNSIELGPENRCWIITGSNMSGKSTFLRSIGVNLLLAKAGTVVCASQFEFRALELATSLRLNDSLEEGLSSFYAEVKQLKTILDKSQNGTAILYLIDEVFRGTNNRERLIGSQAFVKRIAATDSCGLITTHDLELSALAGQNTTIRNYHFKEDIEGDQMLFSYKLAEGPCPTTNALRVMKLAGLPIE
jgi:hypothetical protein